MADSKSSITPAANGLAARSQAAGIPGQDVSLSSVVTQYWEQVRSVMVIASTEATEAKTSAEGGGGGGCWPPKGASNLSQAAETDSGKF